jgi:hypothetical protein
VIQAHTSAARACALSGLLVAALLAPKDYTFFPSFAYLWLPQLAVLGIAWFCHTDHLAAVAGTSIAMALYLAAYAAWLFSEHGGALAWLGYLFSLPGAVFGALMAAAVSESTAANGRTLGVAGTFAAAVLAGILLNQGVVCATVLHCSLR